jgi:hypothetical protein
MSAYDKARDIVLEFDETPGLMDGFFTVDDEGPLYGEPSLTDTGRDWLIAKIEKALREAGVK